MNIVKTISESKTFPDRFRDSIDFMHRQKTYLKSDIYDIYYDYCDENDGVFHLGDVNLTEERFQENNGNKMTRLTVEANIYAR